MPEKIIRIDNIILDYPLWVEEWESEELYSTSTERGILGNIIQFVQKNKNQIITLSSKSNEFITEEQKKQIEQLYNGKVGKIIEIEDNNNNILNVVIDYSFAPVFERVSFGINLYFVNIRFIKY